MSCTSKSEYRRTAVALPGPGSDGLWHVAHPVPSNTAAPGDARHAAVGVGGSIVFKCATSEVSAVASASGVRTDTLQPLTRSVLASGLVTPISSRSASPMNSTSVAVCAFHPKT